MGTNLVLTVMYETSTNSVTSNRSCWCGTSYNSKQLGLIGSNGDYNVRGPFKKFMDWQQCAAVMQREAVTYTKLQWWE